MNNFYYILFAVFAVVSQRVSSSADGFDKEIIFVPAAVQPGPSEGQFISYASGLDAPKVIPINASAYDWWYFDAVSDDAEESIVIVFYTASDTGFTQGSSTTVDSVSISAISQRHQLFDIDSREQCYYSDSRRRHNCGFWVNWMLLDKHA
jgi:hypothetical protein